MGVADKVKSALKSLDLFATNDFLRFNDDTSYATATGGLCSLIIIVIFSILFINLGLLTIERQIISSSQEISFSSEPTQSTVSMYPAGKFLLTVGIMGLDLNANRYFDFIMTKQVLHAGGIISSSIQVPLVACSRKHFGVSVELERQYDSLPSYKWLCPPLGFTFLLSGKYTSLEMNLLNIAVRKCNPALTSDPRLCVPDATVDSLQLMMGSFSLSFFFINPLINPSSQNYLTYYLEDRNFISFTRTLGAYGNAFVEQFTIDTDQSILPFQVISTETGFMINDLLQTVIYENLNPMAVNSTYAQFYIIKSSSSALYSRSFSKITDFFSYVGGLIGTIIGFMFILNSYAETCYKIEIGSNLYDQEENDDEQKDDEQKDDEQKDDEQKENRQAKRSKAIDLMNLGTFLLSKIYLVLRWMGYNPKWTTIALIEKSQQQVEKQLDVGFLIQRVSFLERALKIILGEAHFNSLHLLEKLSVDKAQALRKRYTLKRRIKARKTESVALFSQSNPSKNQKSAQMGPFRFPKHSRDGIIIKDRSTRQGQNEVSLNKDETSLNLEQEPEIMKQSQAEVKKKQNLIDKMRSQIDEVLSSSRGGNYGSQRLLKELSQQMKQILFDSLVLEPAPSEPLPGELPNQSEQIYIRKVLRQQGEGPLDFEFIE